MSGANGNRRRSEGPDHRKTEQTRRSYDRNARFYDPMEAIVERRYRRWRERLWSLVTGPEVLEIGVGTGKNIPFHSPGVSVTAVDLSPRMLERAARLAGRLNATVDLQLADAQALEFAGHRFDEVVATFVFCSVPDPVLGLREAKRVLKPGGRLFLIEHVRSTNALVAGAMDLVNPIAVRATGVNINRRTAANVLLAGLSIEQDEPLGLGGIFRLIVARNG
jgi:ubiquinone/menaquinone biosynthesis C-methylase UbiE